MGRRRSLACAFAIASLAVACGGAQSPDPASGEDDVSSRCSPTSKRKSELELSVWPDAGEAVIVDPLQAATKSIRLMVYMLGQDGVFKALVDRHEAGVDVRVILDGGAQRHFNQPAFDALGKAGVKVEWSDPKFSYMHAKSIVIDDELAIVSTGNFPKGLILDERNYVVADRDPDDVKSLASVFDADFTHTDPSLTCTRLLVSPVNSKPRVLQVLDAAKKSLLVETLELADADILQAIIDKKKAGLDVRVVIADPSWSKTNNNAATAKTLAAAGVPVRWIPKSRFLVHVKNIQSDGKLAYMGSENLTTTSLTKNREIGVEVTDGAALATMAATFEADYASANAF
ncbi:MAG TPA: phospholipase D-like domain-containing protein [Labilithrix sp.]|jgi:phosphatidylserine/phosphatidylglycerophosphate/cardiolipin synthase-like enzyme